MPWRSLGRYGYAVASGLPNTVAGVRFHITDEVLEMLAEKGLLMLFGNYRWPSERCAGELQ